MKDECIKFLHDILKNEQNPHKKKVISYIIGLIHEKESAFGIILEDKSIYEISEEQIERWELLYPNVNIEQELRRMQGWSEANPSRRKTRRGILRFITNWLSAEQGRGGGNNAGNSTPSEWDGLGTLI